MNKYIDVPGDGTALPRDDRPGSTFPIFESSMPIIPRNQWQEMIGQYDYPKMRRLVGRVKRQAMGSCASHAMAAALEVNRNKVVGVENFIELSPLSVYKFVGRAPNSGSTLSGNMRRAAEVGFLPLDTPENRQRFDHVWPENQWQGSLPSGWESTASKFRLGEYFDITSFDGMMSALLSYIPVYYGRAGHAILGMYPVVQGGGFSICYLNSWGNWGDQGYGFDTERFVSGSIRSYGCFAPRMSTILDDDQLQLKV